MYVYIILGIYLKCINRWRKIQIVGLVLEYKNYESKSENGLDNYLVLYF